MMTHDIDVYISLDVDGKLVETNDDECWFTKSDKTLSAHSQTALVLQARTHFHRIVSFTKTCFPDRVPPL